MPRVKPDSSAHRPHNTSGYAQSAGGILVPLKNGRSPNHDRYRLKEPRSLHFKCGIAMLLVGVLAVSQIQNITVLAKEFDAGFLKEIVMVLRPKPTEPAMSDIPFEDSQIGEVPSMGLARAPREVRDSKSRDRQEEEEVPTQVLSASSFSSAQAEPEPPDPPATEETVITEAVHIEEQPGESLANTPPSRRSIWNSVPVRTVDQFLHPKPKQENTQQSSAPAPQSPSVAPSNNTSSAQSSSAAPIRIVERIVEKIIEREQPAQEQIVHLQETINNIQNTINNIDTMNVSETVINAVQNTYATNNVSVEVGAGAINATVDVTPTADALGNQAVTGTSQNTVTETIITIPSVSGGTVIIPEPVGDPPFHTQGEAQEDTSGTEETETGH